jgi:DNA polymerase III delta prime subunit
MEMIGSLLDTYQTSHNIPHLLFHGEVHSGKRKALQLFLNKIYTPEEKQQYCMFIECSLCKGIKMIRDDIKEFVKQQCIHPQLFKSIILYDAENLTIDAQYSLRRCIEIYSNKNRFFIVTSYKDKLLNPICSRFVHVYFPTKLISRGFEALPPEYETWKTKGGLELVHMLYLEGIHGDRLLQHYTQNTKTTEFTFLYDEMCKKVKHEKMILFFILKQFEPRLFV